MLKISSKSDLYSFGILLFEIFTGQLPWGGESALGLKQLYSDCEIPDPCELNGALPPLFRDILRRVTSADPSRRPPSASEIMKMVRYAFDMKDSSLPGALSGDQAALRAHDADDLIYQNLARWAAGADNGELGLTKFALIHRDYKTRDKREITDDAGAFMLFHALKYGYKDDYWWANVSNPSDRLSTTQRLFAMQNEVIAARVLDRLAGDDSLRPLTADQSSKVAVSLLEMAAKSKNRTLSRRLLSGLQAIAPTASAWGSSQLNPEVNTLLGELAIEDSDLGDQAAQVTGRLHSQPTVDFILKRAGKDRLLPALLEIQQSAGSLPAGVPLGIRLRVALEWIGQRLTFRPARLFGAYLLTLTGAAFGIASQVYLTFRLPEFMDIARISSSLERGLITGTVFGLGLFLARMIVERFHGANPLLRMTLGTVAGTVGMNIAMFIFHVLFVNTPPDGFLITLGCAFIAFVHALGGLIRSRVLRVLLSTGAVILAITGTWWLHLTMAATITDLTPLFYYDFSWSASKILFTSTLVALWIGVFGNLTRLGAEETGY
ncbi:MAG: protein kinase [Chloroflexi bacterium]|nr:protein kinase [Chloroflexota bacterium]